MSVPRNMLGGSEDPVEEKANTSVNAGGLQLLISMGRFS